MRALIAVLFFATAAWFLVDPSSGAPPVEPTPPFDHSVLEVGPPRQRMHDPAMTKIGGIEQRCSNCHNLFQDEEKKPGELLQHGDLSHDHGMNDRCFNCHSKENREMLVGNDGSQFGFDEVQRLCGKCHGLVFRDWQRGIHGRTNGSWDASSGLQRRLVCTDCHDPHSPAYKPIPPLPGPHTLRMGHDTEEDEMEEAHGPLQRFLKGGQEGGER